MRQQHRPCGSKLYSLHKRLNPIERYSRFARGAVHGCRANLDPSLACSGNSGIWMSGNVEAMLNEEVATRARKHHGSGRLKPLTGKYNKVGSRDEKPESVVVHHRYRFAAWAKHGNGGFRRALCGSSGT
jgi:hypothetical protein